jgi:hypothetical protein
MKKGKSVCYSIQFICWNFRRKHDRQIQDRIRQITDRMLRRRLEARSSLFEEKRQVRLELREVKKLPFILLSSILSYFSRYVDLNSTLPNNIDQIII